jgi:hypothetical protein
MSAEPVVPVVRRKKHEMIADALAAAKLKQAMRPAATPAVRPALSRPKKQRAHARPNPATPATPATPASTQ